MTECELKINALIDQPLDRRQEVLDAVLYFYSMRPTEFDKLNCKIRVTNEFVAECRRIHFRPNGKDSNGICISPMLQSDEYKNSVKDNPCFGGKTVILINNSIFNNANSDFFKSVVIHELSHCADNNIRLPNFQKIYNINMREKREGTVFDAIGGYFCAYSEINAKFWQERFWIEHHNKECYDDVFYKRGKNFEKIYNFDAIQGEEDYYHAQHCAGKLRCWEEVFIINPIAESCEHEEQTVNRIKEKVLNEGEYHDMIKDMYKVWDWEKMLDKCKEIYTNNQCNLYAKVETSNSCVDV